MIIDSAFLNTFMVEAVKEAKLALETGEVPVGAVIVMDKRIIARAHNMVEAAHDPTAHAEILAIREAAARIGDWRLSECELYVTLEPCPMCAWAITKSRIRRLYFGSYDRECGAADSKIRLIQDKCEIYGGINESMCDAVLKSFFSGKRTRTDREDI